MARKMKDSGIPWVGNIPEGWEVTRLKYQVSTREEKGNFVSSRDKYIGLENVASNCGGYIETDTEYLDAYYDICKKGDLLYSRLRPYLAKCIVAPFDGFCTGEFLNICSCKCNKSFLRYWLVSPAATNEINASTYGAKMPRADKTFIMNLSFLLPPLAEQKRIAEYLDKTVGRIDGLREKISREIERLGDYKKSMISEAVCRGLDKTAKMKDSGVFWQPQRPEGWRVTRLKYVLKKMVRYAEQGSDLLICTNKGKVTKRGDSSIGLIAKDDSIYQGVKKGDLLIHGMDTWHGAIAVSDYDGMCTPVVHVCESNEDKAFISYYLRNMAREKIFKLISNSVRENSSDLRSWEKVGEIKIILPPKDEQLKVSQYLLNQEKQIDALIEKRKAELERLEALKRSIICECVTGKREVAS